MRSAALLSLSVLLATMFAGCTNHPVQITDINTGDAWNKDGRFRVVAPDGSDVKAVGEELTTGKRLEAAGPADVTLALPDGIWRITYYVAGRKVDTLEPVKVDSTPPTLRNLVLEHTAQAGEPLTLAVGASASPDAAIQVTDLTTGQTVSNVLPFTVGPFEDGVYLYRVAATDEAGNLAAATIQVRVGAAAEIPAGQYTFGVVGRYSNQLRLWDISEPARYASRATAQQRAPGHLGAGHGIDPSDPTVRQVVATTVTQDMNTLEAAQALFVWMAGNLRYDFSRLESNTLMTPHQVLNDREDPADKDCDEPNADPKPADCDGIVADGAGNGVKGGICRDLAATYVSLLRAAGVPARLVSGYLGGQVNGFHAWVQFYGGEVAGQSEWVVVDVSPVNGTFTESLLVQSFAIQPTDYLALRNVPADREVRGWSTALDVQYSWPRGEPAPEVGFGKNVQATREEKGVLCFNPQTHARKVATEADECGGGFGFYVQDVTLRTERVIDYGIHVKSAPAGTTVDAEVAYPFLDAVRPNGVAYRFYSPSGVSPSLDVENGKARAEITY